MEIIWWVVQYDSETQERKERGGKKEARRTEIEEQKTDTKLWVMKGGKQRKHPQKKRESPKAVIIKPAKWVDYINKLWNLRAKHRGRQRKLRGSAETQATRTHTQTLTLTIYHMNEDTQHAPVSHCMPLRKTPGCQSKQIPGQKLPQCSAKFKHTTSKGLRSKTKTQNSS